jgi:hypothetical protein
MKYKIKITKCGFDRWYAKQIGAVFFVKDYSMEENFLLLESSGSSKCILEDDCEILETIDDRPEYEKAYKYLCMVLSEFNVRRYIDILYDRIKELEQK